MIALTSDPGHAPETRDIPQFLQQRRLLLDLGGDNRLAAPLLLLDLLGAHHLGGPKGAFGRWLEFIRIDQNQSERRNENIGILGHFSRFHEGRECPLFSVSLLS